MTSFREVQAFIGSNEKSLWELMERFEHVKPVLLQGLASGDLVKTEAPRGIVYRNGFPGVDIDHAHPVKR